MYGDICFIDSASMLGLLIALRIAPPLRASAITSATSIPQLSCASFVEAPKCGVNTRFGNFKSGLSFESGSDS